MIRGVWTFTAISWVIVAALLPVLAVLPANRGIEAGTGLAISFGIFLFWQLVFAFWRGQHFSPTGLVTAVALAVLAPPDLAFWQLLLALSFGAIIGELIFGGWGRNVLSAAVVTLAFLYFSFPQGRPAQVEEAIALACLPAAVLLLLFGILSWRVVTAFVAALAFVTALHGADLAALPIQAGLAFGLIFLVGDPVASASTNPGRWLYGALAGGLTGLFGWSGAGIDAPQTIIFAALLASIFSPLIDHGVVAVKCRLRRRQHA